MRPSGPQIAGNRRTSGVECPDCGQFVLRPRRAPLRTAWATGSVAATLARFDRSATPPASASAGAHGDPRFRRRNDGWVPVGDVLSVACWIRHGGRRLHRAVRANARRGLRTRHAHRWRPNSNRRAGSGDIPVGAPPPRQRRRTDRTHGPVPDGDVPIPVPGRTSLRTAATAAAREQVTRAAVGADLIDVDNASAEQAIAALATLTDIQRAAIVLRFVDDFARRRRRSSSRSKRPCNRIAPRPRACQALRDGFREEIDA